LRSTCTTIETEAVLERLTELGCDTGQGYFISRPLPAAQLTAKLTTAFGGGGPQLRPMSATGLAAAPADP
jgi:predicted signal transduction protein with EAL and GGDEF domain